MRLFPILLFCITSLLALDVKKPILQYQASGSVVDMVVDKGKLYAATTASCVDVFNLRSAKKEQKIEVSRIKDFMEDVIDSKVYSVDIYGNKLAILSQADRGVRRVHLFYEGEQELLISQREQLYISKLRFLDEKTLLLGLLGNEIISYDIEGKKINWRRQVSHSKFSDFVLNEKKDEVVVADESGDLKIFSVKDGALIETLSEQNLDNVFQVDYKSGIIATAGQDRRVAVYDVESLSAYYKASSFLIYSVGLSPSGKRVAYASDEHNNITVFNTVNKEILGQYTGNKMTLTKILFLSENEFLAASDDKTINLFQVK